MSVEQQIETVLRKRFAKVEIVETSSIEREERLMLRRRNLIEALRFLRSDPDTQIDLLVDIFAIQHLDDKASSIYSHMLSLPFFEVVYVLRSTRLGYRVRISTMVPEDLPSIPTISELFHNASWLEREMWDLHGIYIESHPNLKRLVLYSAFSGHPLRKDYPLKKYQPLVELREKKSND